MEIMYGQIISSNKKTASRNGMLSCACVSFTGMYLKINLIFILRIVEH